MNLLIGAVILLCLLCSEMRAAEAVSDSGLRILLVGFVTLLVPGLALFQTLIVSRRLRNSDLAEPQSTVMLNRLSVCHSAIWLTASLAIVWAVRWQDVVRGNWQLDRWPLIDEAIIILPIVFSLVASWAIFFDIQQSFDNANKSRWSLDNIRKRVSYVSIRFRIYLLMFLVPLSIAVVSRDIAPWMESLENWQAVTFGVSAAFLIMAGFPFLLMLMWKTARIEDKSLRSELLSNCKQQNLFVHDVRIWKTGNRIVNALVAGILPYFRVILITDSLVRLFPRHELLAVLRHEAGHLRLWHLPTRIGFIALPLVALAIDEKNATGFLNSLNHFAVGLGFPNGAGLAMPAAAYVLYLLVCLPWLSHRMEYEADIYACQSLRPSQENTIDPALAKNVSDALLRLASVMPSQFEKSSMMHPSIQKRLLLVRDITQSPEKAHRFRSSFKRRRRIALAAMAITCLAVLVI